MTATEIATKARSALRKRDRLRAELAAVEATLNDLRGRYMMATKTFGIHPEAFRREVTVKKVA